MRVYSAPILASVSQIRHMLEMNGIECEIRGEFRSGGAGEIPATEAWPELWVIDPAQAAEAIAIVEDALKEAGGGDTGTPWRCVTCGESVEAQFATCWNCGQAAPDDAD
jgi:hypothetical protein